VGKQDIALVFISIALFLAAYGRAGKFSRKVGWWIMGLCFILVVASSILGDF